jgi:hypothetical protein
LINWNSVFFEMIRFHRDNVTEISYTSYLRSPIKLVKGADEPVEHTAVQRKVFKVIFSDFKKLYDEISLVFEGVQISEIYEKDYLFQLKENAVIKARKIDLCKYAKIDIVYCLLFFGMGKDDRQNLVDVFGGRYKEEFYNDAIMLAALKPKQESSYWRQWEFFDSCTFVDEKKTILDGLKRIG